MPTEPNVNTPSREWRWMESYRTLPRLMRGGVRALREAAAESLSATPDVPGGADVDHLREVKASSKAPILVINPLEEVADFERRIALLQWWDPYWTAIERLGRKPFSHEIDVTDESPAQLLDWTADIDGAGRDLRRFASDVCVESSGYGIGYLFSDWSEELNRPVMSWIDPQYVIAVDIDPETGRKRARIRTVRKILSRWTEKYVPQVTVIYGPPPGGVKGSPQREVWEPKELDKPEEEWHVVQEAADLRGSMWPMTPLYTGFLRPDVTLPPADSLAELARIHLNKLSRLDAILDTANVPIREWAGVSEKQIQKFKAIKAMMTFWTDAKAQDTRLAYVEHSGAAIGKAMDDLDRVERRMEVQGWAPLVTRPRGNETATSILSTSEPANTQAEAYTIGWADAFAQHGIVMADQAELETSGIGVRFHHDFGIHSGDLEGLKVIADAMAAKGGPLLPWITWFKTLERYGQLPEDDDPQDLADMMEAREQGRRDNLKELGI